MANTYIKIYLHLVFAVKNREALIPVYQLGRVHSYITGLIKNKGQTPIRVNGVTDHVHVLMAYDAKIPIPDLVRDVKAASTAFINENRLTPFHFQWQKGYSCMSYSQSQVEKVAAYIDNQNEHHRGLSLKDEIKMMLDRYGIEYDDDYLFENVL